MERKALFLLGDVAKLLRNQALQDHIRDHERSRPGARDAARQPAGLHHRGSGTDRPPPPARHAPDGTFRSGRIGSGSR